MARKAEYVALRCEGGPKVGHTPRCCFGAFQGATPRAVRLKMGKIAKRSVKISIRKRRGPRAGGGRGEETSPLSEWSNTPDRGSADWSNFEWVIISMSKPFQMVGLKAGYLAGRAEERRWGLKMPRQSKPS